MKFLIAMLSLVSVSAFASFNEVECEGRVQNKVFVMEIEQPFPAGSVFRWAKLNVTENGVQTSENFQVTFRSLRGFNTVRYTAAGVRLEVDHWPDQAPRWGRVYRGSLFTSLPSPETTNLDCRFPNAF